MCYISPFSRTGLDQATEAFFEMSLPWEVLVALADSVIVSLFYVAFKEASRTVMQIQVKYHVSLLAGPNYETMGARGKQQEMQPP